MINAVARTAPAYRSPTHSLPPVQPDDPGRAAEEGWIGQVPPPPPREECACPPPRREPDYAVPELAPEPWHTGDGPAGSWTDPTLFG